MQERERVPKPEGTTRAESLVAAGETGRSVPARSFEGQIHYLIEQQEWIDPVAKAVQRTVGRAMKAVGPSVTDFLHGTWLRHPLHVALTDVPIGAWTAAVAMDAMDIGAGRPTLTKTADTAIAIGIAAAVPAAVTGLVDWRHVYAHPRRVGLVHALLNTTGLLLQAASLALRLRGNRRPAIALSTAGFLSTASAAWLGGQLTDRLGIGVDHNAFEAGPEDFVPVLHETELPERQLRKVEARGVAILLYRRRDQIFAMADTCSHQGCSLAEGRLDGENVVCACHGSQYRLADGTLVHGPSTFDQPRYEVRLRDGRIELKRAPIGS